MKFPFYDSSNRTTSLSAEPKQMCSRIYFGTGPGGWDSWDSWDGWDGWDSCDQQINRQLEAQSG